MENLRFILCCIGVFAGIMLLAGICEKKLCKNLRKLSNTHYISYTAIFSALAGVLMTLDIPLFFAPSFYTMDISELPILICTFYLGPVAGVLSELIKVLVKLMIKGTTTAFVGDFANFVVGCSFILPASLVYHGRPGRKSALIGMVVGTLSMTVFGSSFNALYLIPKFSVLFGMPIDAIVAMGTKVNASISSVWTLVLMAVVPFNILKGTVVSALTFLLYKRISPILHKGDNRMMKRREKKTTDA